MTLLASTWLGLALLLSVFAWFAKRRAIGLSLPIAVALAAVAVYIPTGSARFTHPPEGRYQLLGADIQVNIAILALLKSEDGSVRYYRLPYSSSAASQLQNAMDGSQNGSGVKVEIDGEGGQSYEGEPPVSGDQPKTPETPAITLP